MNVHRIRDGVAVGLVMLVLLLAGAGCQSTTGGGATTTEKLDQVVALRDRVALKIDALQQVAATLPADDPARKVLLSDIQPLQAKLQRYDAYLRMLVILAEDVAVEPTTMPATPAAGGGGP